MPKATPQSKQTPATNREQVDAVKRLADRLKAARELNGWTLREAARRFGYSHIGTLSKIENARHITTIPMWFVPVAAKVYNVSTDYLHGLVEDWDVQPRVRLDGNATSWLFDYMEKARERDMGAVRLLHEHVNAVSRTAITAGDCARAVQDALQMFRRNNPVFQDMKGGAMLERVVEECAIAADATTASLKRYLSLTESARPVACTIDARQITLDLAAAKE